MGSVLTFGLTTVTVTTAAPQGAPRVVVRALGTAIPGGTTSEPVEIVTTSAAVAANATKMSVQPLNRALPLTTLVGGNLVFSPLTFGTTNVLLEDDIALSTVATGATTMKVTSPEGNKFFGGGGGLGMPAGSATEVRQHYRDAIQGRWHGQHHDSRPAHHCQNPRRCHELRQSRRHHALRYAPPPV